MRLGDLRIDFATLALLLLAATPTLADVKFTQPSAREKFIGGNTIPIAFADGGQNPPFSSLTNYVISLCVGGNAAGSYECTLATLVAGGSFASGHSTQGTIPKGVGANSKTGTEYFLQIVSTSSTGGTVTNFSPRFGLADMTGTFSTSIQSSLASLGSTTSGPAPIVNDNSGTGAVGNPADQFSIPYNLQQGLTRYAPMQPQPGSSITAASASPQWPSSSVALATAKLPTPSIVTTLTAPQTFAVQSSINTAPPASGDAAWQKYLNRWKD